MYANVGLCPTLTPTHAGTMHSKWREWIAASPIETSWSREGVRISRQVKSWSVWPEKFWKFLQPLIIKRTSEHQTAVHLRSFDKIFVYNKSDKALKQWPVRTGEACTHIFGWAINFCSPKDSDSRHVCLLTNGSTLSIIARMMAFRWWEHIHSLFSLFSLSLSLSLLLSLLSLLSLCSLTLAPTLFSPSLPLLSLSLSLSTSRRSLACRMVTVRQTERHTDSSHVGTDSQMRRQHWGLAKMTKLCKDQKNVLKKKN